MEDKPVDLDVLRGFSPLDGLKRENLHALSRKTRLQEMDSGRVLFKEGESDKRSIYLVSGEIELRVGDRTISMLRGGTPEARIAIAPGQPRRFTARAMSDISYIAVDSDNRSTRGLTEAHSNFTPAEWMMTAAQQEAHVAHTIDWFLEGAFRPEGFDTNWEEQAKVVGRYTSLEQARAWFERAVANAIAKAESLSDAELLEALPAGPIMGGAPRMAIFGAITDHTAHHRGALTVYARLNGIVPPMPYMEM